MVMDSFRRRHPIIPTVKQIPATLPAASLPTPLPSPAPADLLPPPEPRTLTVALAGRRVDPSPVLPPEPELPRCRNCRGTTYLLTGEGVTVCRPCIMFLGGIAADPSRATVQVMDALRERHGDAVTLLEHNNKKYWGWTPSPPWPDAEPR